MSTCKHKDTIVIVMPGMWEVFVPHQAGDARYLLCKECGRVLNDSGVPIFSTLKNFRKALNVWTQANIVERISRD